MDDLCKVLDGLSLKSITTKMWVDDIIKPFFIMMLFIWGDHEGDFALHLTAAEMMMPYLFAANKHRYSRYGLFLHQINEMAFT